MDVWVVEQGEYSDYRVVGVFSSKENAQRVADFLNASEYGDDCTVAEWTLDPAIAELNKNRKQFTFQMQKDGTVDSCEPQPPLASALESCVRMWRRSTAPAYVGKGVADVLTGTVWAKDEKHAIKIANEHRAEFIASGEWDNARSESR